ncbi:MAG TPA: amino acid ABC transporter permease [Mycobacteriales bacterium]|nr:amino acid ABC transporter permease [Mycobacteriales bacterium]
MLEPTAPDGQLPVVPVRHPGRWVAVAVIALLLAMLVHSLVVNPNWQWSFVQGYFGYSAILGGIVVTLELTALAMLLGILGGVTLAVMRLSPNPIVAGSAWTYTWFFRGTPVLVQLLFWGFIARLYPRLSLGIPFGPSFVSVDSNTLIPTFTAAVLGLGLNEAAYMSEIVRAGILSVDHGQAEAAAALGMRRMQTMRRIVLPQAMRVIVPPTGNETISMLKTTSLVVVLALGDLLGVAALIYGGNFKQIPLLVVASLWYLIMTSVLSVLQYYVERRFARGSSRALPPTPIQRVRVRLGGRGSRRVYLPGGPLPAPAEGSGGPP